MMEASLTKSKGLTGNALKYIAITAMLIDHISMVFIPFDSVLGQVMRIIGRVTAPTMCYFIAEGYYHTRDIKKYTLRLGIFAIISHCPFILMEYGKPLIFELETGVIYTLFLGLIALWIWDKVKNEALKIIGIVCICILAMPGDWMFISVLWILAFGINHGDFKKQIIWFSIISLFFVGSNVFFSISYNQNWYSQMFQLGVFLALIPISMYNGQRGKGGKFNKWVFYIFYPLHLLIIGILHFQIKIGGLYNG